MWNYKSQLLANGRAQHFAPHHDGTPIRYCDVLRRWQADEAFRSFFLSLLADASFSSYRWETPPITSATTNQAFKFVLLDAPGLDRNPEPNAFAEQFGAAESGQGVIAFPNLGNDAMLVVPCPAGPASAYGHLAAFVRRAPEWQKHELCRLIGAAMEARLSSKPIWLSTAGMGVSWLHVRLDSRPKYYGHLPYRKFSMA